MSVRSTAGDAARAAWLAPRAGGASGPAARDAAVVAALALLAVLEVALRDDLSWPLPTGALVVALLVGLPWRRTHPLAVAAVQTACTAAFAVAQHRADVPPDGLLAMAGLLAVPYAVFRWGSGRDRVIGGALLAAGGGLSTALGGEGLVGAVAAVAVVSTTCAAGAIRRERVAAREGAATRARLQEREALARDLHDTVAHHVSAIAIRAQATAPLAHDAPRVVDSLGAIEADARAVLAELRTLVRTLRDPAPYAPTAGMADLRALASPGPPSVAVRIDAPAELPGVVAATLFRIAQEGITNARRHAVGATSIDVAVVVAAGRVSLTVRDDGASATPQAAGGHGLQGMAERVALLGGDLVAGPAPSGGWALRASLPLGGAT